MEEKKNIVKELLPYALIIIIVLIIKFFVIAPIRVNGKRIKENFNHAETYDFSTELFKTSKVPENSYFVLGDNRVNSTDSRIIGYVSKQNILGHAKFTIFPFNRFGTKK